MHLMACINGLHAVIVGRALNGRWWIIDECYRDAGDDDRRCRSPATTTTHDDSSTKRHLTYTRTRYTPIAFRYRHSVTVFIIGPYKYSYLLQSPAIAEDCYILVVLFIFTGSIARSTNLPVFRLLRGRFWGFSPRRGDTLHRWGWHLAWHGGEDRRSPSVPSSMPNFTPIGATTRV